MAIYFTVALITAVFSEISVKSSNKIIRRVCVLFVIALPSLLFAFRYGIGTDYFAYVSNFQKLQTIGIHAVRFKFEWVYILINLIVGKLNGSIEMVFLITSIIMMSFIYYAARHYAKYLSVGAAIFSYMMLYYQMSFNIVRQSVAMAICLYSIKYIHDRKLFKFLLFILIASGFHISALMFFPFYFLYKILGWKNKKAIRVLFYIIVLIGAFNINSLVITIINRIPSLSYYRVYFQSSGRNIDVGFLIRYSPFLLTALYLYKHSWKRDKNFTLIFSLFIIGLILKLSGIVGSSYINRIALNFEITLILIIAYFVKGFNRKRELFASLILLLYVGFNWWYIYIYIGSHGTFPYRSIFSL